eukprot:TRINITY_DN57548_c0_g1_i1.p1 TRINITY_DN57548_c0_g1~~TRINITY_DN57548_c0_g1_i1.p1  ORF type:complete len:501 (+),score=83.19 TRINITY_DN57548_c0_g1_i1:53-1555(+)
MARLRVSLPSSAASSRPSSAASSYRPGSAVVQVLQRRPPSATQELKWLEEYKNRPPSAGDSKKQRSLPWEWGKLHLWLERQPTPAAPGGEHPVRDDSSSLLGSLDFSLFGEQCPPSPRGQRATSQLAATRKVTGKQPPAVSGRTGRSSSKPTSRPSRRGGSRDAAGNSEARRALSKASRGKLKSAAITGEVDSGIGRTEAEPCERHIAGVDNSGQWLVKECPAYPSHQRLSSALKAQRPMPLRRGPSCKRDELNFMTSVAVAEDSQGFAFEPEGIWYQWQHFGLDGWLFFNPQANEQLEEAFSLGHVTCSVVHEGCMTEFNIVTGQQSDGPGQIRRVRMPSEDNYNVSKCSTFMFSADLRRASQLDVNATGASIWDSAAWGERQSDTQAALEDTSRLCCAHDSIEAGYSYDLSSFADWSATELSSLQARAVRVGNHRPARHGGTIKHREPLPSSESLLGTVSPKSILETPLPEEQTEPESILWRSEVFSSLRRIDDIPDI